MIGTRVYTALDHLKAKLADLEGYDFIYVKTKKETHFKIKNPFTECHQTLGKIKGMEEYQLSNAYTLFFSLPAEFEKSIDWPFREAYLLWGMNLFIETPWERNYILRLYIWSSKKYICE